MKYTVRFSEGRDNDWQKICEAAVEDGYNVNVAMPQCIEVDTEAKIVKNAPEDTPTATIDDVRGVFGLLTPEMEEWLEADLESDLEVEPLPETEGKTIVTDGSLEVVTDIEQVSVSKTDAILAINIG